MGNGQSNFRPRFLGWKMPGKSCQVCAITDFPAFGSGIAPLSGATAFGNRQDMTCSCFAGRLERSFFPRPNKLRIENAFLSLSERYLNDRIDEICTPGRREKWRFEKRLFRRFSFFEQVDNFGVAAFLRKCKSRFAAVIPDIHICAACY